MARPEKERQVEELRTHLARVRGVIVTDFRGLNVRDISSLRRKLREVGVEYKVVKNTLFSRAAESLGMGGLTPYLVGPTGVVFCAQDPASPAKVLHDYIRQMRKLEIRGGFLEGQLLSAEQVKVLAELPPRSVILAQALGTLQAPMYGLVRVLSGLQRNLVYALDQLRRSRSTERAGIAGESELKY